MYPQESTQLVPIVTGPPPEAICYVERGADVELLRALSAGEFAHVIGPPGSGKTALCTHLSGQLSAAGARCATVDLSHMGARVPAEGFHYAIVGQIAEQMELPDPTEFWVRREQITPARRFASYLRDELLVWISEQVILFIDGIDALRAIGDESDGFFAALHGLLAERATDRSLRRLSICLLGAVSPGELIHGGTLEPARIARLVYLPDFTAEQAAVLLPALSGEVDLLAKVLEFTDGEPSATARLCQALIAEGHFFGVDEARVEHLVDELFLREGAKGPILRDAARPFEEGPSEARSTAVIDRDRAISLYRRLLFHERVPAAASDSLQMTLRLCGLIKDHEDPAGLRWLRVRNRIFASVFGVDWLRKNDQRPLAEPLLCWLRSGRDPALLLSGAELDEALTATGPGRALSVSNREEQEFLRASLAVRLEEELRGVREELAEEQLAARAEAARRQRERQVLIGTSGALVLVASLVGAALYERSERAIAGTRETQALLDTERQAATRERERGTRAQRTAERAVGRLIDVAQGGGEGPWSDWGKAILDPAAGAGTAKATPAATMDERLDGLAALALSRQGEGRVPSLLAAVRLAAPHLQHGTTLPHELEAVLATVVAETLGDHDAKTEAAWPVLRGHEGGVRFATFSADGKMLATVSDDGTARLSDVRTDAKPLFLLRGHGSLVRHAAFSPDGKLVATASNDHTARLFSTGDGDNLAVLRGHSAEVRWVAFSPDGKRLVTTSGDGTARIWAVPSGRSLAVLRGHERDVVSAMFSLDGKRIVTASLDGRAILWDGDTGKQMAALVGHKGTLSGAAFSPDGELVLTAGADGTARLWSGAGKALRVLFGHKDGVVSAAFSTDGKQVLTAGIDGTARLFDVTTGEARVRFAGHQGALGAAALSPDGTQVVTGGVDHTTRLWWADGRPLVTLRGQKMAINGVAFSPDGLRVVAASGDRTVRVYPASGKGFFDLACRVLAGRADPKDVAGACGP